MLFHPCSAERRRAAAAGAAWLLGLLAGCGPPDADLPRARSVVEAEAVSIDQATAARVVHEYFQALAQGRAADARNQLAAGPRSNLTEQDLEAEARSLETIRLRELLPVSLAEDRIVFAATLEARPAADERSGWASGANARWIEVARGWRGWRIARISEAPIAGAPWAPVRTWAQVYIIEAGVSLEVPNAWQRLPGGWAWAPDASEWPQVGVSWTDAVPDADASTSLAGTGQLVRSEPVELAWGTGTLQTLERVADEGPDAGAQVLEQRLVVPGGARTYVFYARTRTAEELQVLRWVLRRMYISAELLPSAMLAAPASHPECRGVELVDPESPEGRAITQALLAALPQDAPAPEPRAYERVGPITRAGDWVLVDARFRRGAEPAIFALQRRGAGFRYVGVAWRGVRDEAEAGIRVQLAERLPEAPAVLARCVDLARWRR